MQFLENNDIKLRAVEPEDLEILYLWENNTDLWIHGNTMSPYSKLMLRQYINETQAQDIYQAKQLRLMIDKKSSKETIGTIDLYDFDPHHSRAGIGVYVDQKFQNKHYASQSLELIKEYAFAFLHMKQLFSYIAEDNVKSIRIFEKAGFEKSGTLKGWICSDKEYKDVDIYQLLNRITK